jgi:hypothetical protein
MHTSTLAAQSPPKYEDGLVATLSKPADTGRILTWFTALWERVLHARRIWGLELECEPLLTQAAHADPEARDELLARYARARGISKVEARARLREIAPERSEDLTRLIGP